MQLRHRVSDMLEFTLKKQQLYNGFLLQKYYFCSKNPLYESPMK